MTTATVQITFAPTELDFIESQVHVGAHPSPTKYLENLVWRDMAEKSKLREMIIEGMNSGLGCVWTPELGREKLAKAKASGNKAA